MGRPCWNGHNIRWFLCKDGARAHRLWGDGCHVVRKGLNHVPIQGSYRREYDWGAVVDRGDRCVRDGSWCYGCDDSALRSWRRVHSCHVLWRVAVPKCVSDVCFADILWNCGIWPIWILACEFIWQSEHPCLGFRSKHVDCLDDIPESHCIVGW